MKERQLVFSFPEVNADAVLQINFQRTLRIPDDGKDYPLPPGLGSFPLQHIDDFADKVPASWLGRGGVLLPMYQSEALWLSFDCRYVQDRQTRYPLAVKVATGKINAVTGEPWSKGLKRNPQNYLAVPEQPWLDGYCVEKGIIRQFVAMPLGLGYTAEEQITGEAEFGGIQIEVFPMRKEVFERRFQQKPSLMDTMFYSIGASPRKTLCSAIGLAPGGRMRQEILEDPFSIHDWDTTQGSRCFVHLLNSATWKQITGQNPPEKPLTAENYTMSGLPWFDYYDADAKALQGSDILAGVQSVTAKASAKRENIFSDNQSIAIPNIVKLQPKLRQHQVRAADFT